MTSIVNLKGTSNLTNEFFASLNRFHDAKISGGLGKKELSDLLILEGKIFANQVRRGLKTEEDVEIYENYMPTGKTPIGSYPHENLGVAFSSVKQTNTAALFDAEMLSKRTHMPESYSKGLRM